jgi:hypothetical protein
LKCLQHLVEAETAWLLAWREILKAGQMSSDVSLRGHEHKGVIYAPMPVITGLVVGALIRVGAQAKQFGETESHKRVLPHVQSVSPLLLEHNFPTAVAQAAKVAIVRPVEELLAGCILDLAREIRKQVVAVKVDLVIPSQGAKSPRSFSLMAGSPAAASSVGSMSSCENTSL